ncbi:4-hydroxybenzoate octaprenyltransferase [Advenella mimigardefordensis]|uniref:4-hydroxybenzoate octaprenyltransferase n=1 Tax=Advenella mimigardefordensis (strain DSM 17166 / LMG 22922 / DPN7) TaxID=1247726 RepID=W0P7E2_ADVMD|nr:4-hydroxybenzoate octaprenyltransferase [Advenella mimigardefordensis]AHG62759.1 4-hydroxybenzoate octaprenyltransferase [Advenella mimigardefordensis DPN7]
MASTHPDLNDIRHNDWVEQYLPASWRPYARLCRLDRPVGTWLTLLPCIAALIQAQYGLPTLLRLVVFCLGALLMRSVGCTVNDICDRNFDKHVERTRFRPLTSGQITLKQAILFLVAQLAMAALLLFFINSYSRWLAVALVPLVFIYPLCKRFTYWPQLVLGIAFNWGMLMAWSDTTNSVPLAAVLMWMGAVTWQIGYDTIYAYTDMKDDEQLGLRSTALRFRDQGLAWLIGFYAATVVLWTVPGFLLGFGWLYYVFMLAIALHFYWQLATFDIQNPGRSFALFRANIWTGCLLVAGSLGGTLL